MNLQVVIGVIGVIGPLAFLGIGFLKWGLPKVWYDRRTKQHGRLRLIINGLFLLAALCTAIIYVSDRVKLKERSEQLDHLRTSIDSLMVLFEPFEEIARTFYPYTTPPAAIESLSMQLRRQMTELEQRIFETTRDIFERDLFRPLKSDVVASVSKQLRNLSESDGWVLKQVKVYCQEGNRERLLLSRGLVAVLRQAGYSVRPVTPQTVLGRSGTSALVCRYNPTQSREALAVLDAFSIMMDCVVDTIPDPSLDSEILVIEVFGNPTYQSDGRLSLR